MEEVVNLISPSNSEDEEGDDDCTIVHCTGDHPFKDFPHHRENCLVHRKVNKQFCQNCFCMVCDVPASECLNWHDHYLATNTSDYWTNKREERKREDSQTVYSLLQKEPKDAYKILCQIYPYEKDIPLKTGKLHACQRQVLAFAENIETNGVPFSNYFRFSGSKQPDALPSKIYGGMICSEMGMGKTVSAISIMLLRKMLTLIIVPPALVQQWVDDIKKYTDYSDADIYVLYGNRKKIDSYKINQIKVIVAAYATKISMDMSSEQDNINYVDNISTLSNVKRIIIDESHTFPRSTDLWRVLKSVKKSDVTTPIWLLTGTPIKFEEKTSLLYQILMLCGFYSYQYCETWSKLLVNDLKKILIRHEFNREINKDKEVLNIANIKHEVIELTLDNAQSKLYNIATHLDGMRICDTKDVTKYPIDALAETKGFRLSICNNDLNVFKASAISLLRNRRPCMFNNQVKFRLAQDQLFHDIIHYILKAKNTNQLSIVNHINSHFCDCKKTDDSFKAVVITDSPTVYLEALSKLNFKVKAISNSPIIQKRTHEMLKQFQSGNLDMIICTYKFSSIGSNLDLASCIYLCDATMDNISHEQTCARIRRFGTKHEELKIVSFVVKDTISEEISTKHRNGSVIVNDKQKSSMHHVFSEETTVNCFFDEPYLKCNMRFTPGGTIKQLAYSEAGSTYRLTIFLFPAWLQYASQIVVQACPSNYPTLTFDTNTAQIKDHSITFTTKSISSYKQKGDVSVDASDIKLVFKKDSEPMGCISSYGMKSHIAVTKVHIKTCKHCEEVLIRYESVTCGMCDKATPSLLFDQNGKLHCDHYNPIKIKDLAAKYTSDLDDWTHDTMQFFNQEDLYTAYKKYATPTDEFTNLLKFYVHCESAQDDDIVQFTYGTQVYNFVKHSDEKAVVVCANEPSSGQINCILFSQVCDHNLKFDINCFAIDNPSSEHKTDENEFEKDTKDDTKDDNPSEVIHSENIISESMNTVENESINSKEKASENQSINSEENGQFDNLSGSGSDDDDLDLPDGWYVTRSEATDFQNIYTNGTIIARSIVRAHELANEADEDTAGEEPEIIDNNNVATEASSFQSGLDVQADNSADLLRLMQSIMRDPNTENETKAIIKSIMCQQTSLEEKSEKIRQTIRNAQTKRKVQFLPKQSESKKRKECM